MKRKLRTGFTTGTAAAAAAKGALLLLMEGRIPSRVEIELLTGDKMAIPLHTCALDDERTARCSVIKDAGDDPDVTHKAEIGAKVRLYASASDHNQNNDNQENVMISGGLGVGRVTKPGLEVPPGQPAINPGPRKMITQAVTEILRKHHGPLRVSVEVFVPEGRKLAKKTLNARLGILGGISILGTTGLVRPMSHDAFIATIESSLSVARASGLKQVILTTGRRSERFAQLKWPHLPEEAFIQIGDFFQMSVAAATRKGLKKITLAVFFGKAIKMAQGVAHTHAAKSSLSLNKLSDWTLDITKDACFAKKVLSANTARHAFGFIREKHPEVISHVGRQIVKWAKSFAGPGAHIQSVIFDYQGEIVFDSEKQ